MMEWVLTLTSSVVVLCLLGPLVILLGGLMVFGLVGHVVRSGPAVWRTAFDCPFSNQRARVEFLGESTSEQPRDVLSCSVFAPKPYDGRLREGVPRLDQDAVGPDPDDAAVRPTLGWGSLPCPRGEREPDGSRGV